MRTSVRIPIWLTAVSAVAFYCGTTLASAPVHAEGAKPAHAEAASHGSEPDYNKPPLNIEWGLLIVSALLVGFTFTKLFPSSVWEPLIAAIGARELRIRTAHAEAESVGKKAEALMKEHAARMDVTYQQVKEIVAAARTEAEQAKAKIIADAEAQARELMAKAVADVEAAKQEALTGLSSAVDRHVAATTRQVAGFSL